MRRCSVTIAFLAAILALTTLGCGGPTQIPSEKPNRADAKTVTASELADCLATMFAQMSRDELEHKAEMRMRDAEAVKNAEAFVETFCPHPSR